MKVLETGHVYEPTNREVDDACDGQTIRFINKEPGGEHGGTTTQEVIRILLDRTRHCNNCQPHYLNEHVIYHLRQALIKHEMRALERKAEKGDILPEYLATGKDGHFALEHKEPGELDTTVLNEYRPDWDRACAHPKRETTPKLVKSHG